MSAAHPARQDDAVLGRAGLDAQLREVVRSEDGREALANGVQRAVRRPPLAEQDVAQSSLSASKPAGSSGGLRRPPRSKPAGAARCGAAATALVVAALRETARRSRAVLLEERRHRRAVRALVVDPARAREVARVVEAARAAPLGFVTRGAVAARRERHVLWRGGWPTVAICSRSTRPGRPAATTRGDDVAR